MLNIGQFIVNWKRGGEWVWRRLLKLGGKSGFKDCLTGAEIFD